MFGRNRLKVNRYSVGNYITIEKEVEIDIDVDDVLDEVTDDELKEILKSRNIDFENDMGYDTLTEMSNVLVEFLKTKYKIWNQQDVIDAVKDILTMSNLPK